MVSTSSSFTALVGVTSDFLVNRIRLMPYNGSPDRPRCPVVSFWIRCLHAVSLSMARWTTWNGSMTCLAWARCWVAAFA